MRVAVSADKIPLSPFLIFQGWYPAGPYAWLRPENALYRVWTNGYMDTELFCLWLEKLFIPRTARIPKPILLTCDGHYSNLDVNTIDIFVDQNIHLYCLPPRTTNILQPLDVAAFGSVKVHFSRITDTASLFSLCLKQCLNVSKRNFTPIFKDAYKRTWSIAVIKNRFRKCGVYLFRSNAIETTNLKVMFLLHKSQIFPRTQQKTSIHLHQLRVYKAAHTWHVKHYFNPVTFQHL